MPITTKAGDLGRLDLAPSLGLEVQVVQFIITHRYTATTTEDPHALLGIHDGGMLGASNRDIASSIHRSPG